MINRTFPTFDLPQKPWPDPRTQEYTKLREIELLFHRALSIYSKNNKRTIPPFTEKERSFCIHNGFDLQAMNNKIQKLERKQKTLAPLELTSTLCKLAHIFDTYKPKSYPL